MKMNVQIGAYAFTATLEDNNAVREFAEMMRQEPVTIVMDDYTEFEKVGPLGRSLTISNGQTTTAAGDIVLYNHGGWNTRKHSFGPLRISFCSSLDNLVSAVKRAC